MTRMVMQRGSFVLLISIAVLTGFTVRPLVFPALPAAESASDVAGSETAQAFYESLNGALEGAPIDPLAALLSPVFVDHVSDTGANQSADAFLDEVRSIGASPQRPRLDVISVQASGNAVVVGVRPVRNGAIEIAGVTIEPAMPSPHYEVVRVERGRIVDRWAPAFQWLNATESTEAPLSMSSFSGIETTIVRVELVDSNEHSWRTVGLGMAIVESGVAKLQITRGNGASAPVVLEPGSFTSIPSGARARLRSADGNPISVVLYIATPIGPSDVSPPVVGWDGIAPPATITVLWSGSHYYYTQSETVHRPARIVLPFGESVELTRTLDSELLLAGNGGTVEVGSVGGSVAVLGEDRWPVSSEDVVQLDPGHAASISGNGTVFVRNVSDVPVTVVFISIEKVPFPEVPTSD